MHFELPGNNVFKAIEIIAVFVMIALRLSGNYPDCEGAGEKEAVIRRAPCAIEIIGEIDQYDHKTAPNFTIFLKDKETGKWKIYATYICDKKDQTTRLIKGEYLLYSRFFGRYEFRVDDLDREYKIVADIVNKAFHFE